MNGGLILSIICMGSGFLVIGAGCLILYKTKLLRTPVPEGKEVTEIEVPFFGKMRTNYPSLVAMFIGAVLILYPIYRLPSAPEKLQISGNIRKDGRQSHEGIIVGIISGNCMKTTDSDGNFSLHVSKGEPYYTGLAYYREGEIRDVYLGAISIDTDTGEGEFNYEFGS